MHFLRLLSLMFFVFSASIEMGYGQVPQITQTDLVYFKNLCVTQLENAQSYPISAFTLRSIYKSSNENISTLSIIDSFEALPYKRKNQDKIFGTICHFSKCNEDYLFITLQSFGLTGKPLANITRYIISKYSYLCQSKPESNAKESNAKETDVTYIFSEKYSKGGTYLTDSILLKSLPKSYKKGQRTDGIEEYRKVDYYDNFYAFYNGGLISANCEDTTLKMDNGFKVGDTKERFKELFHAKGALADVVFVGIQDDKNAENYSEESDNSKGFSFHFKDGKCNRISFERSELENEGTGNSQTQEIVYTNNQVDKAPQFLKDENQVLSFLARNVVYPEFEMEQRIQGNVLVEFIVNENGLATNFQITKHVSQGLDKEALRVVNKLTLYYNLAPAIKNNKPVKCYYELPIAFKIN